MKPARENHERPVAADAVTAVADTVVAAKVASEEAINNTAGKTGSTG
jgi:hypothetical protein